jgi:hypothetical protein
MKISASAIPQLMDLFAKAFFEVLTHLARIYPGSHPK